MTSFEAYTDDSAYAEKLGIDEFPVKNNGTVGAYMHVHSYSDDDDMLVILSKYELFYERNKPSLQQSLRPATADDMVA